MKENLGKVIAQGAEAVIFLKDNEVCKKRVKKSYRIDELDLKINKLRTRSEAKMLKRASSVVSVPVVRDVDEINGEIVLEYIEGERLSEFLNNFELEKQKNICFMLGELVSKLHDSDIIHGDLTTSNMILKEGEVFFIDFGLSFVSLKFEDKAVDLHLFKQALEAKHFENWDVLWKEFIKGYNGSENADVVLKRLGVVEGRGRYKGIRK